MTAACRGGAVAPKRVCAMRLAGWLMGIVLGSPVACFAFGVAVSPPRFELDAVPGKTVRETFEIAQSDFQPLPLEIATADWELSPTGGLLLYKELHSDSCRPWVAIERRSFVLAPRGRVRFRFEVRVPEDAPDRECRFAILMDGAANAGDVTRSFDIAGRIAVIVYLRVGTVQPDIRLVPKPLDWQTGAEWPRVVLRNHGTATGRVGGSVTWTDGTGNVYRLEPEAAPILPGATRSVSLRPASLNGADLSIRQRGGRISGSLQVLGSATTLVLDEEAPR